MKAVVISLIAGVLTAVGVYLILGAGKDKAKCRRKSIPKSQKAEEEVLEEPRVATGKETERVIPTREWTGGNRR